MTANAALFGSAQPLLPQDAKTLNIIVETALQPATGSAVIFNGTALLQGADGGHGGTVTISPNTGDIEIYEGTRTAGFSGVSIDAADLDAIGAPGLTVGNSSTSDVYIRPDVTLRAAEIFLTAIGNIDVGADATISTIGQGSRAD